MIKQLVVSTLLFSSSIALADLEIRAQVGTLPGKGGSLGSSVEKTLTPNPAGQSITTIGADAMYRLPIIGLALGVRYENLNGSASGVATMSGAAVNAESKITGSRTLALISYRPINLPIFYLGVIGEYSLSKTLNYSENVTNASNVTTTYNFSGTVPTSFGAGVETGLTLGRLLLGLEVGYTSLKLTNMTESTNTLLNTTDQPTLDLSGVYARASLGLSFF